MKKQLYTLFFSATTLFLLLFVTPLKAQNADYSFEFLNLPTTAQAIANGGISLTYITGNSGIAFDNPALFGEETSGNLYLSYMNYISGSHAVNLMYGRPVNNRGCWAVGIRGVNYGKLQGFSKENIATNTFSATDIALEGIFSYELSNRLRGGIALKCIYGNIEKYNAFALAADLGISYYNEEKGTSFGAAITNAGVTIKGFHDKRTAPAWDFRIGYSQALQHAPIRLHTTLYGLSPYFIRNTPKDLKTITKILRHFTIGAEYLYKEKFWLGVGYNPRLAQDLQRMNGNMLSGISLGTGFNHKYFNIAIAASRYHPSAFSFMISISSNFGNDKFIF